MKSVAICRGVKRKEQGHAGSSTKAQESMDYFHHYISREEILPRRESSKMKISRGRGREGELVQSQSDFHFATNSAWQKSFPDPRPRSSNVQKCSMRKMPGGSDSSLHSLPLPRSLAVCDPPPQAATTTWMEESFLLRHSVSTCPSCT